MPCSSIYCINGTGTYDGNYGLGPAPYNSKDYYTGDTLPTYYIFSSSTSNSWCLSTYLGGPCLLFGKSPCVSACPDLCDDFFGPGPCVTPTPTPTSVCDIDFDAIFDCAVTPTPTPTPSVTPTLTPTPTPTQTNPCGGLSVVVSAISISPTPTPTPSLTPTQTPDITRPCNFTGKVKFNTIDDFLRCANSKRFRECTNGFLFHSNDVILDPIGNLPSLGVVYRANINGDSVCVVYDGIVENISGADNVVLLETIGLESTGACSNCFPIQSQTPTPTPTNTPTPTPTASPLFCFEYLVNNTDQFHDIGLKYIDCNGQLQTISVLAGASITICASSVPPPTNYLTITEIGDCLI